MCFGICSGPHKTADDAEMDRSQLEAWLIPGAQSLTMGDVARIAGADARVETIEFASLAFTVAILRDVFPDDESVFRWVAARKATIIRGDLSALEEANRACWWNTSNSGGGARY